MPPTAGQPAAPQGAEPEQGHHIFIMFRSAHLAGREVRGEDADFRYLFIYLCTISIILPLSISIYISIYLYMYIALALSTCVYLLSLSMSRWCLRAGVRCEPLRAGCCGGEGVLAVS